jgi:hypothetical protein
MAKPPKEAIIGPAAMSGPTPGIANALHVAKFVQKTSFNAMFVLPIGLVTRRSRGQGELLTPGETEREISD